MLIVFSTVIPIILCICRFLKNSQIFHLKQTSSLSKLCDFNASVFYVLDCEFFLSRKKFSVILRKIIIKLQHEIQMQAIDVSVSAILYNSLKYLCRHWIKPYSTASLSFPWSNSLGMTSNITKIISTKSTYLIRWSFQFFECT